MKQIITKKDYRLRLASGFGLLDEKNKQYIEDLTGRLAEIHQTAPETRRLSEKTGKGKDA
jgi:hypothetical protein